MGGLEFGSIFSSFEGVWVVLDRLLVVMRLSRFPMVVSFRRGVIVKAE